jgi:hypothetical protein
MTTTAAEFIPTNKGGRKLVLDGYLFVLNRKSTDRAFWRCSNFKTCPATVVLSLEDAIISTGKDHTHGPEKTKIEILKRTIALKEAVVKQPHRSLKELYNEAFAAGDNEDVDFVASRPDFKNVKSTLHNKRGKVRPPNKRQHKIIPPNKRQKVVPMKNMLPRFIEDVGLEEILAQTYPGKIYSFI